VIIMMWCGFDMISHSENRLESFAVFPLLNCDFLFYFLVKRLFLPLTLLISWGDVVSNTMGIICWRTCKSRDLWLISILKTIKRINGVGTRSVELDFIVSFF